MVFHKYDITHDDIQHNDNETNIDNIKQDKNNNNDNNKYSNYDETMTKNNCQ